MFIAPTLAFLSALSFAASNTLVRRGVLHGSVAQAIAITVPLGALIGWPWLLLAGPEWGEVVDGDLVILSACAGTIHFIFGRYCNYRAIQAMGANLVAPVQQASIVVTLALAVLILGESLNAQQGVGIALVLASPLVVMRRRPRQGHAEGTFRPDIGSGYFYAALSALAFGVSPVFVGLALRNASGVVDGIASGTWAYTAAAVLVLGTLVWRKRDVQGLLADGPARRWYVLSGIAVAISQFLGYMALAIAPVSVVVPIQRISIVLRFGLAGLVNRQVEVFGLPMVFATVTSLAGALLIAIDPYIFQAWLAGLGLSL